MTAKRRALAERRKAAGYSQEALAEALRVEPSTVGRWERGETAPQPWFRPRLARALSISDQALNELLCDPADPDSAAVRGPTAQEMEIPLRRDFIGGTAGLALSLPSVVGPKLGRRVGSAEPSQLLERTARLRRLDDILGGADTYWFYAAELASTTALAKDASYTSSTRRALMEVVAEQAQLAGWAAFDAGMQAEAKQHYLAGLTAAREAKNSPLAGNSLAFLAYQAVSTEEPDIDTALASYETAEHDASPRVCALLLERLAWTYAVAGRAQETERALARAEAALHCSDERPEPDWVFWVDEDELQIMAGRCWTELHRPLRAVSILENVLAGYDDTHARDKALYLTWLATSYLDAGEPEQAAVVIGRAFDLATGIGSVRPAARVGRVLHRLQRYRALPSVAALLERVRN